MVNLISSEIEEAKKLVGDAEIEDLGRLVEREFHGYWVRWLDFKGTAQIRDKNGKYILLIDTPNNKLELHNKKYESMVLSFAEKYEKLRNINDVDVVERY